MKTLLSLFFFTVVGINSLWAQVCQPADVFSDPAKREQITNYIRDSRDKRYFVEDKGIVIMVMYEDKAGQLCWRLSTVIDDRYRKQAPEQFATVGNDIVVIYKGDSNGKILPASKSAVQESCLQEIVGGRVYEFTAKPQYTFILEENKTWKKMALSRHATGNQNNDLIIVFNKNKTVSKFTPA